MTLHSGDIVQNRYRIVRLLGQGGFGAVYRAWDTSLNIPCALKENLEVSPEAARQFAREATLLANLHHPNLPRVTDHFSIPGQGQYLVMDLVEGEDLSAMLGHLGHPLAETDALRWTGQVCDALTHMHAQNPPVIHRDIKPKNIIITPQGRAMLVDFGIAKIYDPRLPTTTGARAVSPGYSPPEQYGTGKTDARTDVYALGATLYAILTEQEPTESVQRSIGTPLFPPRRLNSAIQPKTELLILKAMELSAGDRFQSTRELKTALAALIARSPASVRPVPLPQAAPHPALPAQGRQTPVLLLGAVGVFIALAAGLLALAARTIPAMFTDSPALPVSATLGGAVAAAVTSTPETSGIPGLAATASMMIPNATRSPPATATAPPSATFGPCNRADFVSDVTVPDNTVFAPGAAFTKTWRLRNTGACTWTTSYAVVFVDGDPLGGATANLAAPVEPGQQVDITVNLVAPGTPGTYKANWKLRSESAELFGLGKDGDSSFWVQIEVR